VDMLTKDKSSKILKDLYYEINNIRKELKAVFNPYFGSVFRTHTNQTYFSYMLQRYADVYTAAIENFNNYPHDFTHGISRTFLPHERDITNAKLKELKILQEKHWFMWCFFKDEKKKNPHRSVLENYPLFYSPPCCFQDPLLFWFFSLRQSIKSSLCPIYR